MKEKMDRNKQRIAIARLLSDRAWHRASEIRKACGGASEALRRLRELREAGHKIVAQKFGDSSDWGYKLCK